MSQTLKYNLATLEWQQFEALAYKCLVRDISPSLQFVDGGKDKGRDFLFKGTTDFFSNDGKAGSYVFQAKHKSGKDPFGALQNDLGNELHKVYIDNGLRQDHYCLVTNLILTGDQIDALEQVVNDFMARHSELPSFEFHIYSYRHFETCLDKHKEIRCDFTKILSRASFEELLLEILDRPNVEDERIWRSVFQRNQIRFVHTAAYDSSIDRLIEDGLVLLSGPPKAGKTFTAYALMLRLAGESGFIPYQVSSVDEFKRTFRKNRKQVFLFDDAFGRHHHDVLKADELDRSLEYVLSALDEDHKCILTSREYIYRGFADLAAVDVAKVIERVEVSVDTLSIGEKESLFLRYLHTSNATLDLDEVTIDEIIAHENFSPETLRSYFDENSAFDLDVFRRHLKEPDAYLDKVFANLNDIHKLILLAVLFSPRPSGDCISYTFKLLCIDRNQAPLIELGKELHLLTDSVVRKDAERYSFYHPSMYEYFIRLMSRDLALYRSLMLKNLNADLLQLVGFVDGGQATNRVAIGPNDIEEITAGLCRLISHPYTKLVDLNSMFEWFGRDDVLIAFKVRLKEDYRKMMRSIMNHVFLQPLTRFATESSTQLAMFFEHVAGKQSIVSQSYPLDKELITSLIKSRGTDNEVWQVAFTASLILGESESLRVIGRDWFNQFYIQLKAEINYLGQQLYGSAYPNFPEVRAYQEALASPETRVGAVKKSRSDYMLKTGRDWFPRFKAVREKMYRLKGCGPIGRRIHDKLVDRFSHLASLQDRQQNRYVFLKEKKFW